jgi:Xaa-Pro aminopeptidase
VFTRIRAGRPEQAIAADIDFLLRSGGFERPAFETIVASGPNAALPHARPSERMLSEGDLVVLDFGGVYDSYCVDLTRTVAVGPASPRAREVHDAVRGRSGRPLPPSGRAFPGLASMRRLARPLSGGHGRGIWARTGHGLDSTFTRTLGSCNFVRAWTRETKPPPPTWCLRSSQARIPGLGGVRIEDDFAVTQDGARLLTTVTTELLEL